MSNSQFRERIRRSLANPTLQIALDANAERRVTGRLTAFASLPDWQERRRRAHAVRADVIDNLDEYLREFVSRAQENGVTVHRAADAAEAIETVLRITESSLAGGRAGADTDHRRPALVAKSKSMVSEEIDLNPALEARGIRVVETDLGEYIVQLREEKPAHIITPAVHLRRDDVGRLFHEKLGIPYTEDIPTLIQAARGVLREVFFQAQVGISGVNFGVAETGTLCLVTNEGNGRMVTTLPPVHIALMGMERLVRNLDDLALMLSLLARSATTQKMGVYTQLIRSPLPGQQRHLILLDNGRTRLRGSPLRESLYCIRCGACLNACPVFREIGGHAYQSTYSGPIGSVISAGLFGPEFIPLAQASSLCGACKEACPVDIDLPGLLTRVRAGQAPSSIGQQRQTGHGLSGPGAFFMRMYSLVTPNPRLFRLSQRFAALATHLAAPIHPFVRMPGFTGWGYSKDLPRFAGRTFRDRWARLEKGPLTETERPWSQKAGMAPQEEEPPGSRADERGRLVARFEEELIRVNGAVIHSRADDLTGHVINFLKGHAIDRIHLEPNLLDEAALRAEGIGVSHAPDAALPLGVTKAVCGMADTGSILIIDGEGAPLQASLLPRVHLAVLCASGVLPSLRDALALPIVRKSGSAVVVTGPSRTADIEMSLTIGMHGPGELHVFVVDD